MRQYVGARYVPKFFVGVGGSPEWVAGIPYEALTVVTYLNNSYTSKKPVPVGVDILNTDYWVCTANFSSQLQEIYDTLDTLTNGLNTTNTNLDTLDDYVRDLSSAKFWYISDSFGVTADNWCSWLDTYVDKTSYKTAEANIGYVHVGGSSGLNLADKITAIADDLTDITDVIVVAGINDCNSDCIGTVSTFNTAFTNAMSAIHTKAPNAKIWIVFNATFFTTTYSTSFPYINKVYRELIGQSARNANVRFIKSPFFAIQYKIFSSDGVHLNEAGSKTLAVTILNKLRNGSDATPSFDTKVHGINYHLCELDNVTLSVQYGDTIYNDNSNPFNLSAGIFADIYESHGAPILPKYNYHFCFGAKLELTDSSNVKVVKDCLILPSTGDKLALLSPDAVTNIVKVKVVDCVKVCIPLMQYV